MVDPYATDAQFYDLVHGRGGEDIDFWCDLASQSDGPVLEVGTGTGRIAVPLASQAAVTGIDPSNAMLAIASGEATKAGVAIDLRLGLVTEVRLERKHYGLVALPADVFLYCADASEQVATLRALKDSMTSEARLALDLAGPALWLDPDANGRSLSVFHGFREDGSSLEVSHVHNDDLAKQTRRLVVTYALTNTEGVVSRNQSTHLLRYVYPSELVLLFERAGLTLEATYGDYLFGPLTNDSDRMIVVARRSHA